VVSPQRAAPEQLLTVHPLHLTESETVREPWIYTMDSAGWAAELELGIWTFVVREQKEPVQLGVDEAGVLPEFYLVVEGLGQLELEQLGLLPPPEKNTQPETAGRTQSRLLPH